MSDEISSKSGLSGVIWPGLIVLAVAVFGFKTTQPFLESARPKDSDKRGFPNPPSPPGLHAFYARLWEDPLLACYQQEEKHVASVWDEAFVGSGRSDAAPVGSYKETLSRIVNDGRVLCLPVLLPGTPFGDDHEHRMRAAYAVYAALAVSGYELAFPARLSYVDVPVELSIILGEKEHHKPEDRFRVPIKLFRISDAHVQCYGIGDLPKYIVVLWINEDQAQDRPLNVIAQILYELFQPAPRADGHAPDGLNMFFKIVDDMFPENRWKLRLDVDVLGPADSDGLKVMRRELVTRVSGTEDGRCRYRLSDFAKCAVHSSRSTLPYDPETDNLGRGPRIRHVIGDDRRLAEALVDELALRGATDGKVVLLTEQDTLYGSSFGKTFRLAATPRIAENDIREYRFLRGIDGALAHDRSAPNEHGVPTESVGKPADNDPDDAHEAPPRGRAQKDYLSRLEQKLVEFHYEDRMNGGSGIKAIGVVGTDVYDKLLILRALRKRFPKIVFFTTDLDAAFAKTDELATARNLIVASHFGLGLNEKLQRETPPFRDSYQTATYFGTLIAIGSQQLDGIRPELRTDPWGFSNNCPDRLKAIMFEIGLDGPYQLTQTTTLQKPHTPTPKKPTLQKPPTPTPKKPTRQAATHIPRHAARPDKSLMMLVNPQSPREAVSQGCHFWRALLFSAAAGAITLCALPYLSAFRRAMGGDPDDPDGRPLVWALAWHLGLLSLIVLLPFPLILGDHLRPNGQPFSIRQGISLWPATYLRYVAFCTSIYLLYVTRKKLRRLQGDLYKQYKKPDANSGDLVWDEFKRLLRSGSLRAAWDKARPKIFVFNSPAVWSGWKATSRFSETHPSAMELCKNFAQRWDLRFTLVRILPLALGFFFFVYLLMKIDDFPSNPSRGDLSAGVSFVVVMAASLAMILLTFMVIDAEQLCRRFIGALEFADLDWISEELDQLAKAREGDSPAKWQATRAIYTMHIIIECSKAVAKLIRYPFIVVFLMATARLPAFDYLDLNWILVLVWVLLLGLAGYSAYDLRATAAKTRREIVKRLRDEKSALAADPIRSDQQRQAIADIENETGGAFGSPWNDPLMTALAIPFGGSTLIILIQLLLPYLIL